MRIVNLTQHWATPEQREAGVFDLPLDQQKELVKLLTFHVQPVGAEMYHRAKRIAEMARVVLGGNRDMDVGYAMIGGAPYFMRWLVEELDVVDIIPLYAFSKRVSVEETQPDGTVKKIAVFRHEGFVRGCHHE